MNIYTRQSDTYASGQYVTSRDYAPRSLTVDRNGRCQNRCDKSVRVWRVDYRGPLCDSTIRPVGGCREAKTITAAGDGLIAYLSDFDFRYVGRNLQEIILGSVVFDTVNDKVRLRNKKSRLINLGFH